MDVIKSNAIFTRFVKLTCPVRNVYALEIAVLRYNKLHKSINFSKPKA